MPKRAQRRADRARMIAKARRIWPNNHPGKYADNLARCSCWMCGNLRHQEGATIQERRMSVTDCY